MRQFSPKERFAVVQLAQADLYFFSRWMFGLRKGYKWIRGQHHKAICDALMRVFSGDCKRLIINVPPRYSKTEIAVINFISWALGHVPDAEFIHTSYSGRLAGNNAWQTRELVQSSEYREIFPEVALRQDSQAKDEWRTTAGGCVYAVGAGGTITGYGAGKHRPGFGGCFPAGTKVWTESGLLPIDEIVREKMNVRVWAFDYNGNMVLRPITGWHENPPNEIARVTFDDGATVECTPDHRFWTDNRGWVRADSLRVDDRLPSVNGCIEGSKNIGINAERFGSGLDSSAVLATGSASAINESGRGFAAAEDSSKVCFAASLMDNADSASNGLPCVASPDLIDNGGCDPVLICNGTGGNSDSAVDGKRLFVAKNCNRVSFCLAKCSVPLAVNDVGAAGIVSQINEPVIGGLAVAMANVESGRLRADESQHNKLVDVAGFCFGVLGQVDAKVSLPVIARLKDSFGNDVRTAFAGVDGSALAPNAALVADGVKPFISGYRQPVLFERVRHDEITFCLTVEDYHNFTVESGFVVKNCIIIDDPHKADEARSDVIREGVIDWFQNTLESRKNAPNTPIILIMQRLHERDLAGWLLSGGNGEEWEHVCLPALQADATALWPEKHTADDLLRMQEAAPYTFAGQYQQAPAPPEGNIFKPDKIEVVDAVPAGSRFVRAWDLAATTPAPGKDPDWTAGGKLGITPSGRWIIADMNRMRGGPEDVESALVNTAKRDGTNCRVKIPQDPGQAGKSQVSYLTKQLSGFPVTSAPVTGDKITRAEPFAAQTNVGNVMMLRAPWNDALVAEMRLFPNGAHDDQIDALSDAFSALNTNSFGMLDMLRQQAEAAQAAKQQQKAN